MDQKMVEAASKGDLQLLHQLLVEYPFILSDHSLNNSNENPLTIAIKANQLAFASEILMRNSQLALVLNQDGTRPLDVAAAHGNVEIVKQILMLVPSSSRLTGKDGRTAIHYAAMNGNVEIMNELLSACSDCAKDVTAFGETCLHLAVKFFRFKALEIMLQWLEKTGTVDLVNSEDMEGNSVLHYAASRKQLESVKLILEWNKTTGNKLELNATNKKGMTPLDILDILIESSTDIHLRTILINSGASSTSQFRVTTESPDHSVIDDSSRLTEKPKKWSEIVDLFTFKWGRDSTGEARGTLLVVLALVVTITFQAGINPPDYLTKGPKDALAVHLVANTVAFATALNVMEFMLTGFPFTRELKVAFLGLGLGYVSAVLEIKPNHYARTCLIFAATLIPIALRFLPSIVRNIWKCFTK